MLSPPLLPNPFAKRLARLTKQIPPFSPSLEDSATDVVSKAAAGQGVSLSHLEAQLEHPLAELFRQPGLPLHSALILRTAELLELDPSSLLQLALGKYEPRVAPVSGLIPFSTSYGEMLVNSYLIHGKDGLAVAFDSGGDSTPLIQTLQQKKLKLHTLFLTHSHGDHIFEMDRIREATKCRVLISREESIDGADTFAHGESFEAGSLKIETRLCRGHSPSATTYVIHGLTQPVAIVGDALFAGSMGGAKTAFQEAIKTGLAAIFSLPDETQLGPGHGPLTTVALEKKHNPFFAPHFK